ncbi:MAG: sodium-dependent transporter [Tissierellia bacterium]|nr:sodium-dependent transporter [Tissierellia bacterium]
MSSEKNNNKGTFNSNFGFLMSSIGSAVGLGNLWGFPYKMGMGGGFAFLLIYVLLVATVGYPLMVGEIALGRKTGKAAIQAFKRVDKRFTFTGYFDTVAPFLLICFYVVFGGYIIKYFLINLGDFLNLGFGLQGMDSGAFFEQFMSSGLEPLIYTYIFLFATFLIVVRGISGGIERFSNFAMPALFVMLLVVVFRANTLPGAREGLAFIFKPNFEVFKGMGWLSVLGNAGSQMFFSLSLSSGAVIAYGSYLSKSADIESNGWIIPVADSVVAVLAAMAVMPAVFAFGLEPGGGPGLLFVSLQTVFQSMGATGPIFGMVFYLLVLFAALTSSIAMTEGAVSAMLDGQQERGKEPNRLKMTLIFTIGAFLGGTLVSLDALGSSGMPHPFGLSTWLDVFDLGAEGILMPLGGLFFSILLGWFKPGILDDEVALTGPFRSRGFYQFSLRWIAPVFLFFIVIIQLNAFFGFFPM